MLLQNLMLLGMLLTSIQADPIERTFMLSRPSNFVPNKVRDRIKNRYRFTTHSKAFGEALYLEFRFNNGQCTDWADARYFQLSGYHTEWWGDARLWPVKAAKTAGWVVSNKPKVPCLIVIQPNIQNCGPTGHVAVVEAINADGTVHTSNYNWKVGRRGGPYVKTFTTFKPGPGVKFIWHN